MKCKKHNQLMVSKDIGRGKTIEICQRCEDERAEPLKQLDELRSLEDRSQKMGSMGIDENIKTL